MDIGSWFRGVPVVGPMIEQLVGGELADQPATASSTSGPARIPRTTEGQKLLDAFMQAMYPTNLAQLSQNYMADVAGTKAGYSGLLSEFQDIGRKYGEVPNRLGQIGSDMGLISRAMLTPSYDIRVGNMSMPVAPLGAYKAALGALTNQGSIAQAEATQRFEGLTGKTQAAQIQANILSNQATLEQQLFDTYLSKIFNLATQMEGWRHGQSTVQSETGTKPGFLSTATDLASMVGPSIEAGKAIGGLFK